MVLGRMFGEYLKEIYPNGLAYFDHDLSFSIIPATYALAGIRSIRLLYFIKYT